MEKKIYGIIYLLIDGTNDFEYIGQTTRSLEVRFKQHTKNKKHTYISNAIQAHGAEMFVKVILKVCYSKEELDYWEKRLIKSRDTMAPNGYNLREGGEGGGSHSAESRAKNSAAKTGKPLAPEHCKKISESLTGKPKSPEHVAKVAAANTGKKRTPEQCARMSVSKKGKKRSPEAVAKTAAKNTGKKRTPEQCAKISAANTGKKRTPEQCANISAAQLGKKRGPRPPEVKAKISVKNTGKKRTPEQRANISAAHTGKKRGSHSPEHCAKIAAARHKNSPFKNLVAELKARQMSYTSLAELMGLKPVTISHKMIGRKNFTDNDKKKLTEIFGKPVEYLMARDE